MLLLLRSLLDSEVIEPPIDELPTSLGGRNKLFDTPTRRVIARLAVTDDDDRLYAVAKVTQLVQAAKVKVVELAKVGAGLSVLDDADTLQAVACESWPEADTLAATAKGSWPARGLITAPKTKLVSSRYEVAA